MKLLDGGRRGVKTGGIITSGGSRGTKTGGCIPSADAIGTGGGGPFADPTSDSARW